MSKTKSQEWKNEIIGYRKKCQNILKLSDNIRYAGVINIYGRTLTGIIQPEVKPLIQSQDIKNEFFTISTLISMRNKTTKDVGKGTGLGLSICRGIVDAHKGTITVKSEVNKGTELIVKIPNN